MRGIIKNVILIACILIIFSCESIIKEKEKPLLEDETLIIKEKKQLLKKNSFVSQLNDPSLGRDESERNNELKFDTLKSIDPKAVHILDIYGREELDGFLELSPTFSSLEKLSVINVPMNYSLFDTLMSKLEDKPHLKKLMIHSCELKKLPSTIAKLQGLEVLKLFRNPLAKIPPEIGLMKELREIYFYNAYQLKAIPPELGQLKKLEMLQFAGTRVEILPAEISNCKKLWHITANANRLKSLPPEIGLCSSLRYLNIGANKIKTLPPEIGNLTELDNLSLGYNQLSELPETFKNLKKLTYLTMGDNQFSVFPKEILELHSLFTFWIHKNRLKSFPVELGNLQNLEYLMIDHSVMNKENLGKLMAMKPQLSIRGADSKKIELSSFE